MEFNYKWLNEPRWSWVRPGSNSSKFQCVLCHKQLTLFGAGTFALAKHANRKRHMAFEEQVSDHNILLFPGAESIKNLKLPDLQIFNMNAPAEENPISKGEKTVDKRRYSNKTIYEIHIPLKEAVELEGPPLPLDMDSEGIPPHNAHFNLQNEEEAIMLMKKEPDSVNSIVATDMKQVSKNGMEIGEPIKIKRLSQEIEILQHCAIEKAELCEATGNIRYVIESNIFRRIAEEKNQELEKAKELTAIFI